MLNRVAHAITPRPRRVSRLGPNLLIVAGVALLAISVWALFSGVRGTVRTFTEAIGTATDPRRDVSALTPVPGSASARLRPGRYQVVAIGPQLTTTRLNPGGMIANEVLVVAFARPPVTVDGPAGSVPVGAPSVDQLVDSPGGDLVAIGEFDVTEAGTYTLHASGEATSVSEVGITDRPDVVGAVKESFADTGKIMLGAFGGFTALGMLIGGIVWKSIRRRRPSGGLAVGFPVFGQATGWPPTPYGSPPTTANPPAPPPPPPGAQPPQI
jgi:hypothetical protein